MKEKANKLQLSPAMKSTISDLGYSKSSKVFTRRLLTAPKILWNNEIIPFLDSIGMTPPKHEFNVHKWISYERFIGNSNNNQRNLITAIALNSVGISIDENNQFVAENEEAALAFADYFKDYVERKNKKNTVIVERHPDSVGAAIIKAVPSIG